MKKVKFGVVAICLLLAGINYSCEPQTPIPGEVVISPDTTQYMGYKWQMSKEYLRHTADSFLVHISVQELEGVTKSYSDFFALVENDSTKYLHSDSLPVTMTMSLPLIENKTFGILLFGGYDKDTAENIVYTSAEHFSRLEVITENGVAVIGKSSASGECRVYTAYKVEVKDRNNVSPRKCYDKDGNTGFYLNDGTFVNVE